MIRITQQELNNRMDLHEQWIKDSRKGYRLVLKGYDLSKMDLSLRDLRSSIIVNSNLSCSDLYGTIFFNAGLYETDFTKTNLTYAIMSQAILEGAIFTDANLADAIGNGFEIQTLQTGFRTTNIIYPTRELQISCHRISFERFFNLDKIETENIQKGYWEWVKKWRPIIKMTIKKTLGTKIRKQNG